MDTTPKNLDKHISKVRLFTKDLATKFNGTVKWFNVKRGYGIINRHDTKEDIFIHQSDIKKKNPRKSITSVGDGEEVEFDIVVRENGKEATNVTGPEGSTVEGSPHIQDRATYRRNKSSHRFNNILERSPEDLENATMYDTDNLGSIF